MAKIYDVDKSQLVYNGHYAVQTCDISSNVLPGAENRKRICSDDKAEVIEKCLTSFFASLEYLVEAIPYSVQTVKIFDDHSSQRTLDFFSRAIKRFASDNIKIEVHNLEGRGIMNSTRHCFEWMDFEGDHLVYQVQDDFLFKPNCIFEMIDLINQVRLETDECKDIIAIPFNDPFHWYNHYKYKLLPRMVVMARHRYWLTTMDLPSGFMTTAEEFRKHWDLYEAFLALEPTDEQLEPKSINKICFEYRTYALRPFDQLAFHMQGERELDPYEPWEPLWNSIEKI